MRQLEIWKCCQVQAEYGDDDLWGCDFVCLAPQSDVIFIAKCANSIFGSLLFALTAFMSFRNVMHFRRTGTLPDAVSDPSFAAQSKAAFSSTPVQDFDEEEDFRSGRGGLGPARSDQDEDYALLEQSEVDDLGHPGRSNLSGGYDPTSHGGGSVLPDYSATSYGGAYGQHYGTPSNYTPSEYGPTEYGPTDYGSSLSGHGR